VTVAFRSSPSYAPGEVLESSYVFAQFKHLNWFVCVFSFCSHFFNLNCRPTRYAYCRKYVRKTNRGTWEDADTQKAITERFGLNVALQDANQAKKHQSSYNYCRLSPITTAQVTTRKRKAQVDPVQTMKKWRDENAVPTVDKAHFQAIFASTLVVMSYDIFAIFVV